jgi:GH18 family chitinase
MDELENYEDVACALDQVREENGMDDADLIRAVMDYIRSEELYGTVAGEVSKDELIKLINAIDAEHPELMVV